MKKVKISKRQKDIIIGKLLGDGHLETQTNGKTYRLKIEHSIKQKEYVNWTYDELKSLASNKPKERTIKFNGKEYEKIWFNSISTPSLRFYGHQFYVNSKKVVPINIHRWLTPLCMAVWYMDDGSIKSKHHRAKILNTHSFSKFDLKRLRLALKNNYGIETKLRRQKEGNQIYLLSSTIEKFENIIKPYIIESMKYKIG